MARKWEIDGDNSGRLPSGIVVDGYDADTRTYYYRDVSDGTRYRSARPGQKYGVLIPINSDSKTSDTEEPVVVMDNSGKKHVATPYRPLRQSSVTANTATHRRAATFGNVFTRAVRRDEWDNESRTVVDDDGEDYGNEKGNPFLDETEKKAARAKSTISRRNTTASVRSSSSPIPGIPAKKGLGMLARSLSRRLTSRSSSPRYGSGDEETKDGDRGLSYDPESDEQSAPRLRRRAATTFDEMTMLSESAINPKKNAKPLQRQFSMKQTRTRTTTW